MFQLNISIFLTLLRMISAPLLVPFFIVYAHSFWHNVGITIFFLFLGFTDFLDGFLARRYQIQTVYGKVLDPLADKFLMYAALVSLLAVGKIALPWVIILIGREFFVMGIRQIAYEYQCAVQVSYLGKIKTTIHFILVLFLLMKPLTGYVGNLVYIEYLLLMSSTIMSLWSGADYFYNVYKTIKG